MNRLASPAQLRASFIRWALFLVPSVILLGFLSSQLSGSAADNAWFAELRKPALFPPPAAFGIAWSVLYVLMGLAMAAVCSAWGSRYRLQAIAVFMVQLVLNLMWSPVFFFWHQIELALGIIVLMAIAVAATIALFLKVRRWAGLILLPYLAWVLFAGVLNFQFWQLNPEASSADPDNAVQRIEL